MHVLRSGRVPTPRPLVIISAIALSSIGACKESSDPVKAASIVGMAATDSVRVGKTLAFEIEARDADGKKVTGRRVTWSSLNPSVAAVDNNGVVTGVLVGATVITARADDATATTNLIVQQPVTTVVLFPSTSSVPVGGTQQLTVAVSDRNGLALAGRAVSFSSSNTTVATVNSSGTVIAIAQGQATITAQAVQDQISGTATVNVVQVPVASVTISPAGAQTVFDGLTLQLSATLRDASNNLITGRPISWTTSNQAVASVSPTGVVTGVSLGSAQITAESEGRTAAVQVTVAPRPVATVALTPNPASVRVGQSLQMALDLRDASGNQVTTTGRSIVWDSSNKPVATVQDGVVSGQSAGTATITVTVDGKPASSLVTVAP